MQKYCLFHKYHDIDKLYDKISDFIKNKEISSLNIYSYKIDALWNAFRKYFVIRIAAGGLLKNENEEFLFIKRRSKWDIPKGHLERNESLNECVVREIKEETGFNPQQTILALKPSYHIYRIGEKWILKETHWYVFSYMGKDKAVPLKAEEITEVRWFSREEIKYVYQNTWPSISDVIHEAFTKLNDN
ncbi:MAG: NUDIX domain-containing protein [Bacteroidota bacterium]|nr:NUDIX domain-containing protein [Bacteroidota bacterium]